MTDDPTPDPLAHLGGRLANLGITLPGPGTGPEGEDEEAPYGYWPEPCRYCGTPIARKKPASEAGRPPEYCDTKCQNDAKAARARERNAPGLPGQIGRVEETVTRLEQVASDMRLELRKINSPEGIEARLAAARAANASDVAQANQTAVQAQADAAAARSEAQQAHTDREAAEAAAARDRAAREAADAAREDAQQRAAVAELGESRAKARADQAEQAQQAAEVRADEAEREREEARRAEAAAVERADLAVAERDQARQLAAAADARADAAEARAEKADARAEKAERRADAAEEARGRAEARADQAEERRDKALVGLAEMKETAQAETARADAAEAERHRLQQETERLAGELRTLREAQEPKKPAAKKTAASPSQKPKGKGQAGATAEDEEDPGPIPGQTVVPMPGDAQEA